MMLTYYGHHGSAMRETHAWASQYDAEAHEARMYFAGYCLDATEYVPSGSTLRIEPRSFSLCSAPFAASTYAFR